MQWIPVEDCVNWYLSVLLLGFIKYRNHSDVFFLWCIDILTLDLISITIKKLNVIISSFHFHKTILYSSSKPCFFKQLANREGISLQHQSFRKAFLEQFFLHLLTFYKAKENIEVFLLKELNCLMSTKDICLNIYLKCLLLQIEKCILLIHRCQCFALHPSRFKHIWRWYVHIWISD